MWRQDGRLPDVALQDYRSIVEHLDAVPSGVQADIGRLILRKRGALEGEGGWQSGFAIIEHRRAVLYACDTYTNYERPETFVGRLLQLANARATEFRDAYGYIVPTLGVGVLQGDGWIDYQYAFVREPMQMPRTELSDVQGLYGRFDRQRRRMVTVRPGRNELCPCGSGSKYKYCCGQ